MADEVTVNSALCPLQDGITHDIVVGGSSVHKDNNLQYGYGFTGRSKRAAREDHIHPLNINLSFMPFPVGAFPPEGLSSKPNIASAYPGAVGDSNYKTRTYALANHIHSYMFADYIATSRNGAIETFKPLKDGAKWTKAIPFAFVANGKGAVGLEYSLDASNIAGVVTENRVEAGFSGMANYPARADHSHPLNVPPSSDTDSKSKEIGKENKNGESAYYARLDHEHMLGIPEVDENSSELTSGYLTINNNFVSKDAVSWAPDADSKKSITVKVACRVSSNNVMGGVFFRTLTFNSEGRLVSVSGENDAAVVVTDSTYGES